MGSGEGEQYQTAERNGTVKFYNGVQRKGSCFRKKQFPFWRNEMAKFYDDDCKVLDRTERKWSGRSKHGVQRPCNYYQVEWAFLYKPIHLRYNTP